MDTGKKVINLGEKNSLLNRFLSEVRSETLQKDRQRFRKNMERIGEIFSYEVSRVLQYQSIEVTTPLGSLDMNLPTEEPVLAAILRASLPMHQGFLNYFDKADNAFISAYRHPSSEDGFEIKLEYVSSPNLNNRIVIVIDPMLATGASMVLACEELFKNATPAHVHIACAISSTVGIDFLKQNLDSFTLWTGAIDDELTAKAFIVPGLGDAGDLAFGAKD